MSDLSDQSDIFRIRPATQADQATITALVHAARINPMNLRWPNFLVAEEGGRIVGVGQLRPHPDGSWELASLAVDATRRHQGIGSQLVRQLLTRRPGPIYLICKGELGRYYARFGFRAVDREGMSPSLARLHRIGSLFMRLGAFFRRKDERLIVMRWEGE